MAGKPFSTKALGPQDLSLFRSMNQLFGRVFEMPEEYGGAPPPDDYALSLLGGEQFIGIVALDQTGKDVIGALAGFELKKFEQARSEIYIYDLAVHESWRRQGVATSMIEAVKPIARARNAWVIFVQADKGDEPPIALYSKLGAREEALHFDISPGSAPV